MKVYVVGYTTAYDGGDIAGVYSSRELAEASWEIRNQGPHGDYEVLEFDLDFDPRAEEADIDRRPRFGPQTHYQHTLGQMFNTSYMDLLKAPSVFDKFNRNVPTASGKTIHFYKTPLKENGHDK